MISLAKWKILTILQKMSKNVVGLDKIIVATGIENLPKVQLIAQSGHTAWGRVIELNFVHLQSCSNDEQKEKCESYDLI